MEILNNKIQQVRRRMKLLKDLFDSIVVLNANIFFMRPTKM